MRFPKRKILLSCGLLAAGILVAAGLFPTELEAHAEGEACGVYFEGQEVVLCTGGHCPYEINPCTNHIRRNCNNSCPCNCPLCVETKEKLCGNGSCIGGTCSCAAAGGTCRCAPGTCNCDNSEPAWNCPCDSCDPELCRCEENGCDGECCCAGCLPGWECSCETCDAELCRCVENGCGQDDCACEGCVEPAPDPGPIPTLPPTAGTTAGSGRSRDRDDRDESSRSTGSAPEEPPAEEPEDWELLPEPTFIDIPEPEPPAIPPATREPDPAPTVSPETIRRNNERAIGPMKERTQRHQAAKLFQVQATVALLDKNRVPVTEIHNPVAAGTLQAPAKVIEQPAANAVVVEVGNQFPIPVLIGGMAAAAVILPFSLWIRRRRELRKISKIDWGS